MRRIIYIIRGAYLWIIFLLVARNQIFRQDLYRWVRWKMLSIRNQYMQFVVLMADYPEFRNICYYRMGKV